MDEIRIAVIGTGYFSHFHFDAWDRIEGTRVVACCDIDLATAQNAASQYDIHESFAEVRHMLESTEIDAVDIVTGVDTHLDLVAAATNHGSAVLCQTPVAPTFDECVTLVRLATDRRTPLMFHTNNRFQPWYRELKKLMEKGVIGEQLHQLSFRQRSGDGWGDEAYLPRQAHFRVMEKFLLHESGAQSIDLLRYLGGEVQRVWCVTRQRNPVIAGEDSALAVLEFEESGLAMYDSSRFNESSDESPSGTFPEVVVEGSEATLRLYNGGRLTIQRLGKAERDHAYIISPDGYAGDCVKATQQHFVDCLRNSEDFEANGEDTLRSLAVQEAMYLSAKTGQWESPQMKPSKTASPFAPFSPRNV